MIDDEKRTTTTLTVKQACKGRHAWMPDGSQQPGCEQHGSAWTDKHTDTDTHSTLFSHRRESAMQRATAHDSVSEDDALPHW